MSSILRIRLIGGIVTVSALGAIAAWASPDRQAAAGPDIRHFELDGRPVGPMDWEPYQRAAREHFGVELADLKPKLILDLELTEAVPEDSTDRGQAMKVEGSGIIRVGTQDYPFTWRSFETFMVYQTADGPVYLGGPDITIQDHEKGGIQGGMFFVHRASDNKTLANITVGTIGGHLLLTFGEGFMTLEELWSLEAGGGL